MLYLIDNYGYLKKPEEIASDIFKGKIDIEDIVTILRKFKEEGLMSNISPNCGWEIKDKFLAKEYLKKFSIKSRARFIVSTLINGVLVPSIAGGIGGAISAILINFISNK